MSENNKDHDSGSDSDDAPEEFTQEQAKIEDAALRKIQRENKARVAREKKYSRKLMAEKITPRKSSKIETFEDVEEEEEEHEEDSGSLAKKGFLSKDIIDFLAEREKQKNGSGSEEDVEAGKDIRRKKKQKSSGIETVLYKDIPPPECLKTGLDFLKKRRAQVPRSSSILKNSGQALRLAMGGASLAKKQRQRK
ncbi:unnamed protein product [Cochlearia groenlandica]